MKLGPYELDQIYTGDARELAKVIPNESVDLIFTDPPWTPEFADCYTWLGELATRVLNRDRGVLMTYCGKWNLPAAHSGLSILHYQWMIAEIEMGSNKRAWQRNFFEKWQPILIYSRNGVKLPWQPDALHTQRIKAFHEWGQSPDTPIRYIKAYTQDNGVIFDPFTGGGTVPAVCKMLGRHYLAFEIDPNTAERARQRVANTQPPLFVPQPEQAKMFEARDE